MNQELNIEQRVEQLEKKVAAFEGLVQTQLQNLNLDLETNLPQYLKDLDVREGSFTHDLVKVIISNFQ